MRKDFFENGRWLVLNVIFLRLHPEDGESLTLTDDEIAALSKSAQEWAERLWSECQSKGFVSADASHRWVTTKHFKSVFSAATDCQVLRNGLLAALSAETGTSSKV